MAILDEHFYHGTIRLYTSIIGTLFDNIKIKRDNGKLVKVPLAYAGQQKQNVQAQQRPDPDGARYKMRLPRISYALNNLERDAARVTNKMHLLQEQNVDRSSGTGVRTQLNRVPYNFTYEVNIKTKFIDDMLQIIEQIVPYFNPSLKIVVNDNPDLQSDTTIFVSLDSNTWRDQFEGGMEEGRIIETSLSFTLEGYLYTKSSDASIINTVYVNYFNLVNPDELIDADVFTEDDL